MLLNDLNGVNNSSAGNSSKSIRIQFHSLCRGKKIMIEDDMYTKYVV